jgi:lysophospholipase L1-like esterase
MRKRISFHTIVALLTLVALPYFAGGVRAASTEAAQSDQWENDIKAFEEQDKKTPPPADAALFIGSSTFRLWSTLSKDLPDIPVINRGFGGSGIADSAHYVERIVLPYRPRLVVMCAGGSDLIDGKQPAQLLEDFKAFVDKVHAGLPNVPIAYIAINPTIKYWKDHDKTIEANRLIAEYIHDKPGLSFIDSYSALLGEDGKPQETLFRENGVLLNREGYKAWTAVIKPAILKLYADAKSKTTAKAEPTAKTRLVATVSIATGSTQRTPALKEASVLFIGNSFTFASHGKETEPAGGVPELFARIARQDGHTPEVKMVATSGATMRQHFNNEHGEITAIQSKKWDYVVLQGHSLEATTAFSHPGEFLEYSKKIAEVIKQNNPATKIVLYETWAYPKAHAVYPKKLADQAQMLEQIASGYRALAREIGATAIAPVGDAFYEAQNGPRHYDLYAPNNDHHANDTGYTLSALVIARTIYGKLPSKLTPVVTDVLPDDVQQLVSIADATVQAWESQDKKTPSTAATSTPVMSTPVVKEAASRSGRWEKDIQAFEDQDKKTPPPTDAALFIGGAGFRQWSTLAQDFSEIPVINRGFGGSEISESTRYVDRIVLPYKPRIVVMFAGGNDLENGKTPAQVQKDFKAFVAKVRTGLPEVPIVYISVNASLARWDNHDKIVEANRLIAEYTHDQPKLSFIDSYSAMLGPDGQPQQSLLRADGLHLNKAGYKAWAAIIKPPLLKLYEEAGPKTAP